MKVLLINQFPLCGGGSGTYTKNIATSLTKLGHSVYIIMPENSTKVEEIEGVTIKPVFFKHEENIKNQLPFNFPCFTTHPRSSLTFNELTDSQFDIYVKAIEKAIEKAIIEFKPDIIHSQHIWILSYVASKYNIPTVITSHGTDIIGYKSWNRFQKYSNEAVDRCKKIITISESNKEQVINLFPKAKNKVIHIDNGYNEDIFYIKKYNREEVLKKVGIEGKYKNIVLFSGRLVQVKGVDILLKSAKIYEKEDTLTIIAGDGILHKELEEMSARLNLKNVIFIGNRSQPELNELYNIADVSVLCSRYEGFGLVAIESLACGTPVVATDLDCLKDVVKKEFGEIVEKENPKALAEGIINVLNKKEKYNSEKIANHVKNNYNQSILIDKVIETYKNCLK